jgi:cytochrome c-type biogenesis protein CcmE
LPSEYAQDPAQYAGRQVRLGGLVEPGTVAYNDKTLTLSFKISDSIKSYPVVYKGAIPDLFKPDTGVVVQGDFQNGTFIGHQLLIKHSSAYKPPAPGQPVDINMLKKTLE